MADLREQATKNIAQYLGLSVESVEGWTLTGNDANAYKAAVEREEKLLRIREQVDKAFVGGSDAKAIGRIQAILEAR